MSWNMLKVAQSSSSQASRGHFVIFPFLFIVRKRIYSMLPCVCSIIDQRRRQKSNESISDTIACGSCATFLSLPHFDFICDLLLNRPTAIWSLFVVTQQKNTYKTNQKKQQNKKKLLDTYIDCLGIRKSLSTYGPKQVQF